MSGCPDKRSRWRDGGPDSVAPGAPAGVDSRTLPRLGRRCHRCEQHGRSWTHWACAPPAPPPPLPAGGHLPALRCSLAGTREGVSRRSAPVAALPAGAPRPAPGLPLPGPTTATGSQCPRGQPRGPSRGVAGSPQLSRNSCPTGVLTRAGGGVEAEGHPATEPASHTPGVTQVPAQKCPVA